VSYSLDFRKIVVDNIDSGMGWEEAVKTFSISRHTLSRWLTKHHQGDSLEDAKRKPYKVRKIDSSKLLALLEKTPDATLHELAAEFDCWPHAIHRRLASLGISRKKNQAVRRKKREKEARVRC
jgi:putative transposase